MRHDREVSYALGADEVITLRDVRMTSRDDHVLSLTMSRAWLPWLALAACSSSKPLPSPAPTAKPACLADKLGALEAPQGAHDTACLEDDTCEAKCTAGSADACMLRAYAAQKGGEDSQSLYARACTLGLAIGCTNYGAGLWLASGRPMPANEICARKLFEKACEVREPWGCGMIGRMMAWNARTPREREAARSHFDAACNVFGGATCMMYAMHLEAGHLGPAKPETVRALLFRACETGEQDACGRETAGDNGGD